MSQTDAVAPLNIASQNLLYLEIDSSMLLSVEKKEETNYLRGDTLHAVKVSC
jgi:hypothetical protein